MSFAERLGETPAETRRRWNLSRPNQELVRHFHRLFGYFVSNVPTIPDMKTRLIREALIHEEFKELSDELYSIRPDIEKIAHEAADLMYVLYGLSVECGFDLDAVFRMVHEANMTKDKPASAEVKTPKGDGFVSADAAIKEYFGG